MKNRILAAIAALTFSFALSGCMEMLSSAAGALIGGGNRPVPQQVANQMTLDEKGAIAIETFYTTFARAGAIAFRTGIVTPSPDPAVQRDDFCPRVLRHDFTPTDRGAEVMALECRLRTARNAARAAYGAGNAASYSTAFNEAMSVYNEVMALIRSN